MQQKIVLFFFCKSRMAGESLKKIYLFARKLVLLISSTFRSTPRSASMTPGALRVNNSMSCHHVARVNSANEAHLFIYLFVYSIFYLIFSRRVFNIHPAPPPPPLPSPFQVFEMSFGSFFRWVQRVRYEIAAGERGGGGMQ